jgi:hypothetical protein
MVLDFLIGDLKGLDRLPRQIRHACFSLFGMLGFTARYLIAT